MGTARVPTKERPQRPKVVIIGGGFGGLYAAKALSDEAVDVTLIDRKNHHTFQPLLYQVALSVLSPGEIASPLRRVLRKADNIRSLLGEVVGFDVGARRVTLAGGAQVTYDYLIVAAGARHAYFGHNAWEAEAPGLKTIEDAVRLESRGPSTPQDTEPQGSPSVRGGSPCHSLPAGRGRDGMAPLYRAGNDAGEIGTEFRTASLEGSTVAAISRGVRGDRARRPASRRLPGYVLPSPGLRDRGLCRQP